MFAYVTNFQTSLPPMNNWWLLRETEVSGKSNRIRAKQAVFSPPSALLRDIADILNATDIQPLIEPQ